LHGILYWGNKVRNDLVLGIKPDQARQCAAAYKGVVDKEEFVGRLINSGAYLRQHGLYAVKAPNLWRGEFAVPYVCMLTSAKRI
jgi:hypothetical protein